MSLLIRLSRNKMITRRRFSTSSRDVGPRHDPYLEETVICRLNDYVVTFTADAFGLPDRDTLTVNGRTIRTSNRPGRTAEALFERLTGVSVRFAIEMADRFYEPDPMGSLKSYE